MDNVHIKQLISELRAIRIRELEVLDAIDLALPSAASEGDRNTASTSILDDGHSGPSNIRGNTDDTGHTDITYYVGDRIEITNKVRRLFNRTPTRRDHTGTVTKVSDKKVEFVTDNGTSTWRAPHNLRKLKE
jgi:hypothetical protein